VFFSWWQPGNLEYHAGNLVPLLLAVALLLRPSRTEPGPARHLVPRLLLLAFAVNLVGNWLTLIEPNRASDLHASASEALERVAPGGLVLGLDRLGHYANLRAVGTCPGERAALPRVLDASDVAAGVDLSSLAQLRAELAAAVERVRAATDGGAGRPAVVATRDLVLPERFEHAPWPLDWSDVATGHVGGMNRLIEGYAALPLDPDAGMASALWELR
jgi:hypothetical protein